MSNEEPEIICPSGFNRPAAGRSFIQWLTYGIIKAPNTSSTASWSMPFFNGFNRSHHHCKLETNQAGMCWSCHAPSIPHYIPKSTPFLSLSFFFFSLSISISLSLFLNYFVNNQINCLADSIINWTCIHSFFLFLKFFFEGLVLDTENIIVYKMEIFQLHLFILINIQYATLSVQGIKNWESEIKVGTEIFLKTSVIKHSYDFGYFSSRMSF